MEGSLDRDPSIPRSVKKTYNKQTHSQLIIPHRLGKTDLNLGSDRVVVAHAFANAALA